MSFLISVCLLSAGGNIILVLMHHTRDKDYSTAGTKWSEIYPSVILYTHVLYHETVHGLLTCPQNTEAVSRLRCMLGDFSENTWFSNIWKSCRNVWPFTLLVFVCVSVCRSFSGHFLLQGAPQRTKTHERPVVPVAESKVSKE